MEELWFLEGEGKKWGRVVLPWWPRLAWSPAPTPPCGSLWLQRWRCSGWASLLFHELCCLLSSSLPAFYRAGLTSKTLSNLLFPCHLPITTSLLSPPRAERRRGCEGEKRVCPIKSNCYKDCRHPAFTDQTIPHLSACIQKISSLIYPFSPFPLPPTSGWSSFSLRVSVRHTRFPSLGVAWKDFDL